jgi:hypothetical protein
MCTSYSAVAAAAAASAVAMEEVSKIQGPVLDRWLGQWIEDTVDHMNDDKAGETWPPPDTSSFFVRSSPLLV